MKRFCLVCALLVALGSALSADSWPGPQTREVFSRSREWFVRIVPGTSIGDVNGFAGLATGPYARAEFFRRGSDRGYGLVSEISLRNPIAPVAFLVTDRGFLVTLDNWHNMGFGDVLVSYSPQGRLVASHRLGDLFTPDEIGAFRHSVSSIWWRTDTAYVRDGEQSIYVAMDDRGSEIVLEPETGRWQFCANRGAGQQCRTSRAGSWQPYREPEVRP